MPRDTHGHIELERSLDSIVVGTRHRKDLGDIDALMRSIEAMGLLQPVTITPDGVLVCGARRLEAMRRLGKRTLQVWVRSGISDELGKILAQQDENAMHKPLGPLEAETLYREAKKLLAEDAARRQASTRFGGSAKVGEESGAADSAAPRGTGDTRRQAANLATGTSSYGRMEQIGWLKRLAEDSKTPPHVRGVALAALEDIDGGAAVDPTYRKVKDALESTQQRQLSQEDLKRRAAESLQRVQEAKKRKRSQTARPKQSSPIFRTVRSFVLTWRELEGWSQCYDIDALARELSDDDYACFEHAVAESVEFAERLHTRRATLIRTE